jgi:hypothetical protein
MFGFRVYQGLSPIFANHPPVAAWQYTSYRDYAEYRCQVRTLRWNWPLPRL